MKVAEDPKPQKKRGPKGPTGPRAPHVGSLTSKMVNIKVGEWIMVPDEDAENMPTLMERNVQTALARSHILKDLRFRTQRIRYIEGDRLKPALKIERLEGHPDEGATVIGSDDHE